MIEITVRSNINVNNPRTAFENFYADMWRRRFKNASHVSPVLFEKVIDEELSIVGAVIVSGLYESGHEWVIRWKSEEHYLMFNLKWG